MEVRSGVSASYVWMSVAPARLIATKPMYSLSQPSSFRPWAEQLGFCLEITRYKHMNRQMQYMTHQMRYPSSIDEEALASASSSLDIRNTFAGMAILLIDDSPVAVLRPESTAAFIGVGESTLWDWLNPKSPRHDPELPRPLELGARNRGFLVSELWAYLKQKAAQRSKGG